MGARFAFSTHDAISQICISFFHVLYMSESKTGGKMYFEAIVTYNSATNVNFKIMEHNINYETTTTADIRRENIYSSSSNDYRISNNDSLTTSDLKQLHCWESIQGGLLHWINNEYAHTYVCV